MNRFVAYLILAVLLGLSSCKSTIRYVPVENVRVDSVYIYRFHADTTYVRDSIHIHEKEDTVTVYKDRYVYRFLNKTDTLYLSRVDSVSVPYPVEKKLTKWERTKVDYGGWAMGIVFVFILVIVGVMVYKIKRR